MVEEEGRRSKYGSENYEEGKEEGGKIM